jgi:25S rRNA (adenine2142-N1)-methyltransferase
MLHRTTQFLRAPGRYIDDLQLSANFPSLFLVLPAPCVTNSRYLDEEKLVAIMESLGYVEVATKTTQRLVYYLWQKDRVCKGKGGSFAKKEIRSGPTRNNFAVVLG